jgi:tetratricopeptide (TPR) repeat protein
MNSNQTIYLCFIKEIGGWINMNNHQIMPTEIVIKDKKRTFTGNVVRVAIFGRSKVFHVQTTDDPFFLLYFDHYFIYGDHLNDLKEDTYISKIFRDGLIVEAIKPIISALIPAQSVTIPNKNKLFSQLQSHFTPQEMAFIMTMLDSFFEKSLLVKFIEQLYLEFRRNGKFMKAFQVLQISSDFNPQFKERLGAREFHSYGDFYQPSNLPSIYKKDPLYAENYFYKNRTKFDVSIILNETLRSKDRYAEVILLWLEKVRTSEKAESIEKMTPIALKFVSMMEWICILGQENINSFHELPDAKLMIEEMVKKGEYEKAAKSLLNFIDDLPSAYDEILQELWGNLEPEFIVSHLEYFFSILQRQSGKEKRLESQIYQLIVSMLKGYDLKTVYEKLLPLKKVLPHSLLFRKVEKMVMLLEDPDQMMELGDEYAEFKQYDHAIDCYSWEMELKPQDPNPVWKISKMYQQKGMLKEAQDYQKVFAQLKNA